MFGGVSLQEAQEALRFFWAGRELKDNRFQLRICLSKGSTGWK